LQTKQFFIEANMSEVPFPKFQQYVGKDGQYYFRLKARNGETILASEGYKSKAACKNGIQSVRTNAPNDARFLPKTAQSGQFYFVLRAANHQVIGTSEMYTTEKSRQNGIEAVKSTAPTATVEEL
jgi:uncharacterized protein YegP (UPF0339 family)